MLLLLLLLSYNFWGYIAHGGCIARRISLFIPQLYIIGHNGRLFKCDVTIQADDSTGVPPSMLYSCCRFQSQGKYSMLESHNS